MATILGVTNTIYSWASLPINAKGGKWHGLLLGNGASIALSPKFGYSSLYDDAVRAGRLPTTHTIFQSIVPGAHTTDFEHVLYALSHAKVVNDALGIPATQVTTAYDEVRKALIDTVDANHCDYPSVSAKLLTIGEFAAKFETVVTLNYDLTLYWAIQAHNDQHGNWLKDGFVLSSQFDTDWKRLRHPYGKAAGATLVFYAHGSLILATAPSGVESKVVTAGSTNLRGAIGQQWTLGGARPLFISEGDSATKLQAIRRSHYLSLVYDDVLTDFAGKNVVAYGLSFHDRDGHVLSALMRRPPAKLAVAVYVGAKPAVADQFCHDVLAKTSTLRTLGTNVEFFDSASPGCWCH